MLKLRSISSDRIALFASLFLAAGFNQPLWQHLSAITNDSFSGLTLRVSFAAIVVCIFNIVLTLCAFRYFLKPVLTLLFMISASVLYFMSHYGVLIDTGMLRNVVETNPDEVQGLLSLRFFGYLLILGLLPSWLLWRLPVRYRTWPRDLMAKALICTGCAIVGGCLMLANFQGLSSLLRNHHELRLMVIPSNYIGASVSYLRERAATAEQPFTHVGEDARPGKQWAQRPRKSLTVLVVGESARAANFGLLGYQRDTTPELRAVTDLVAFNNVQSCGTETAVSVPCMFSGLGRRNYSAAIAKSQDGLLDILKRAGLDVIWRDNQPGCKGTCDRVMLERIDSRADPALCSDRECRDEILVRGLKERIDHLDKDTVLVLHQMGSHGPEYYKRYPKAFEKFTPVCASNALDHCSRDSIVNAYDNTILYTDHVLASLIDILRAGQDKVDMAMIYLSDHGESLGEYNLFLHGAPYRIAPEQQKQVPMLVWLSSGFQRSFEVDSHCLLSDAHKALSQDNLFHSMLGLLQIDTRVYDPTLDIFASCRHSTPDGVLAGN